MLPNWGIQIEKKSIQGVVLDRSDGFNVLVKMSVPLDDNMTYSLVLKQMAILVEAMSIEVGYRPVQIGIAISGRVDPITQWVLNCDLIVINEHPLLRDLEGVLGVTVKVLNAVSCFVLAESRMGVVAEKMPEANNVFGLWLDRRVGGGLMLGKRLIRGKHGLAGEWGHSFLDSSGGLCYCGNEGCAERLLSTESIERYYYSLQGERLNYVDIHNRYVHGNDENAFEVMERLLSMYGRALSNVINMIDPEVVLLGGLLGEAEFLLTEGVAEVEQHILNSRLKTTFLQGKLGHKAAVYGAALL